MEDAISRKPSEVSDDFKAHLAEVYNYTIDTFGFVQAERYIQKIEKAIDTLPMNYTVYPECRHIVTKNRIYRNIILDAHLIIYRIARERIEVLDIVHGASSIRKIRKTRTIRI